jgi:hypothetical protein
MVHRFGLIRVAIHHSYRLIVMYFILYGAMNRHLEAFTGEEIILKFNNGRSIFPSYILVFCFITAVCIFIPIYLLYYIHSFNFLSAVAETLVTRKA